MRPSCPREMEVLPISSLTRSLKRESASMRSWDLRQRIGAGVFCKVTMGHRGKARHTESRYYIHLALLPSSGWRLTESRCPRPSKSTIFEPG